MINDFIKKRPYFIAEISANHNGSLIKAKKLIFLAKKYGADAVKLQTYTAETITIKSKRKEFLIQEGLWKGKYLWDLYNKSKTPFEWHKQLFEYAKKIKITCFSSPFDESAVDLLESLKTPFYKIASPEITHIPLIKKIAKTKKLIIMSTGMANLEEIDFAYKTAKLNGAKEIILLYCVSCYPAKISDYNFNNINILKKKFDCVVGFSDHSLDNRVAAMAVANGAQVIEKHIALRSEKNSPDYIFSLKDIEIKNYISNIMDVSKMMGKDSFYRSVFEKKNLKFRRSIYAVSNIKKDECFTHKNIKVIRPANGIEPYYYDKLINKKSPSRIKKGMPLKRSILKKIYPNKKYV
jgi:pseudaminic acid synthase